MTFTNINPIIQIGDEETTNTLFKNFPQLVTMLPLIKPEQSFIAGGCFKDIFTGKPAKDIDVFFYGEEHYNNMKELLTSSARYTLSYDTDNSTGFLHNASNQMVDLVKLRYGTPSDVLQGFDFNICKYALFSPTLEVFNTASYAHFASQLEEQKLYVDGEIKNPDLCFNRMVRYIEYGFRPSFSLKNKLFSAIRRMDSDGPLSPVHKKY